MHVILSDHVSTVSVICVSTATTQPVNPKLCYCDANTCVQMCVWVDTFTLSGARLDAKSPIARIDDSTDSNYNLSTSRMRCASSVIQPLNGKHIAPRLARVGRTCMFYVCYNLCTIMTVFLVRYRVYYVRE